MSISISNYPVHLQDGFKPNRECLKSQGSQSEYQKVFHRDFRGFPIIEKQGNFNG